MFGGRGLPGFQLVTEAQKLLDFGDDAALFGERWKRDGNKREVLG